MNEANEIGGDLLEEYEAIQAEEADAEGPSEERTLGEIFPPWDGPGEGDWYESL
jgi:hypothetical protein